MIITAISMICLRQIDRNHNYGKATYHNFLSDPGSTSTYVKLSVAKNLGADIVHTYNGSVKTLNGIQELNSHVYRIPVKLPNDTTISIDAIAVPEIGYRRHIKNPAFKSICNIFDINQNSVYNPDEGDIDLLLGCLLYTSPSPRDLP